MFLCQHLGVAPEEGAYSRDKMSDLAYKPPPTLSTSAKVAKRGAYMRDTTVIVYCIELDLSRPDSHYSSQTMHTTQGGGGL